jgi:hypothetical protein
VAEAPREIKIKENPRMNKRELKITLLRTCLKFFCDENSSMETPVIKAM